MPWNPTLYTALQRKNRRPSTGAGPWKRACPFPLSVVPLGGRPIRTFGRLSFHIQVPNPILEEAFPWTPPCVT